MSTQPSYASTPVLGVASVSTANTARDGTGTIVQLAVGKGAGTRIERIEYRAAATTTAGMIRIFKKASGLTLNGDGTINAYGAPSWVLIKELTVAAVTVSDSVEAASNSWAPSGGITLAPYEQIGVATAKAEAINVVAFGGNI